jgi:LPXTG-motif cell wall-anchored protein
MRNSILYIVGALALLGGGAFLFLKSKKNKDKEKLALAEMQKATEVAQVKAETEVKAKDENKTAQDVKNLAEATSVAKQIYNAKKQIEEANKFNNTKTGSYGYEFQKTKNDYIIKNATKLIPTLIQQLENLGYSESYGVAIKK